MAAHAAGIAASKTGLDILRTLDESLATDIRQAVAVAEQLAAEGTTVATAPSAELTHVLSEIGALVTATHRDRAPTYPQLWKVLAPHVG